MEERQGTTAISFFEGEYRFLSNFYPAKVKYEGITYLNSEAAFQASKTLNPIERLSLADKNPSEAKRIGRRIPLRKDWEEVKFSIMKDIVKAKFEQNPILKEKLIATGDAYLEEGNTWGDRIWGVCNGTGANNLGIILMEVREELKNAI